MRRTIARLSRLPLARVWLSTLLLVAGMPTAARAADVTVSTATTGPVSGHPDGGGWLDRLD